MTNWLKRTWDVEANVAAKLEAKMVRDQNIILLGK